MRLSKTKGHYSPQTLGAHHTPFLLRESPSCLPPLVICVVENNVGTTIQLQAPLPHCYYEKIKSLVVKTKSTSEEVAKIKQKGHWSLYIKTIK